ncbi:hypothetical protein D3C78_1206800 [compost metagenome]
MSFFTTTPRCCNSCSISCFTSAEQPPQPVPALVQAFTAAKSPQPCSTASLISPLLTLWQEQICAVAGKAETPSAFGAAPAVAGKIRLSGVVGNGRQLSIICCSVLYSALSPTSTAPSNRLPSASITTFLYTCCGPSTQV